MHYDLFVNPNAVARIEPTHITGPLPVEFHRSMPDYAPTPLHDLPKVAQRLGVARVYVKDESTRLGLPSFKMLGASWATAWAVQRHWIDGTLDSPTLDDIRHHIRHPDRKRLVAATDGNHGRGVARMARLLGVGGTIYVPRGTAQSRIDAIASEGVDVVVVNGSYDDAVRLSAEQADHDTLVVSDTSWDGYVDIPTQVGIGYTTLFNEIDEQLATQPTVVAFQAGVGAFPAAGLRHFRSKPTPPTTVNVEPHAANCLLASARAGRIVEAPPPHDSIMAGLNCGLPSPLAWPDIERGTDVFVAVDDTAAEEAMRLLDRSDVVAGESGAAGLAGLLAIADGSEQDRRAAGLLEDAVVLVVNTEGATDPEAHRRIVDPRQ